MIRTLLGRNLAGSAGSSSRQQIVSRIVGLSQCRSYAAIPNANIVSKSGSRYRKRSFRADQITHHPVLQAELKRTPLFDFHKQNGAKMVPFAGWEMPLSYGTIGQSRFPPVFEMSSSGSLYLCRFSHCTRPRQDRCWTFRRVSYAPTRLYRRIVSRIPLLPLSFLSQLASSMVFDLVSAPQ